MVRFLNDLLGIDLHGSFVHRRGGEGKANGRKALEEEEKKELCFIRARFLRAPWNRIYQEVLDSLIEKHLVRFGYQLIFNS